MWRAARFGSTVKVLSESGEVIAVIGDADDPRLRKKIANAKILALAPEMLDVLIDVQEYLTRNHIENDHPLFDLLQDKIKKIIDRSFDEKKDTPIKQRNILDRTNNHN